MIARLDFQLGTIYQSQGKLGQARAQYDEAKQEFTRILNEAPNATQVLLHAAENLDRLGDLLRNDGKVDQALDEYTESKRYRKRAAEHAGDRPVEELLAVSTSHLKIGSIHQARGDSGSAFAEYRNALRLLETLLEAQPQHIEIQERVLAVQDTIAELQRMSGDAASAVQTYERSLPILESMRKRDPANTTWHRQHGNLYADLGFALLDTGAFKRGLTVLEQALATQTELVARDPNNKSWKIDLSRSYTRAGDAELHLGTIDEAIKKYEQGLAVRLALVAASPTNVPYRRSVAWSYAKLGNSFLLKQNQVRAIEEHERALELRAALVKESPAQVGFRNELASSEIVLGKLLATRDAKRSRVLIDDGVSRARGLVAGDPINNEWKDTLAMGLIARAEAAKVTGNRAERAEALAEALTLAKTTADATPLSSHWPSLVAEVHLGLAEIAPDEKTAAMHAKSARDLLEALATANRLSATRKDLLERARRGR
jgi:tetratricopeptide (TPR) repeat protein